MFWAITVKRPTEGSVLRAGKGCRGAVEGGGGGALRRACPKAAVPESEGPDPACSMGPVIDGPLQAFQPSVRGELGVYGSPAEHRALEVACICRGQGHRAQVVLRRAGDRMGAGLVQPDHRECEGEEKGDVVVREEGNPLVVV